MVSLCTNKSKPGAKGAENWHKFAAEQRGKTCRKCDGAGHNGLTGCPSCKTFFDEFSGQGTVKTPSGHVIVCTRCQGSGTIPLACSSCGGRGNY